MVFGVFFYSDGFFSVGFMRSAWGCWTSDGSWSPDAAGAGGDLEADDNISVVCSSGAVVGLCEFSSR